MKGSSAGSIMYMFGYLNQLIVCNASKVGIMKTSATHTLPQLLTWRNGCRERHIETRP
jgi:hypothetical protein